MPGFKDLIGTIFGGKNPIDSVKDLIGEFHLSPEDKQKATEFLETKAQHWRDFESQMIALDNANTASARDMNSKIQGDKPTWMAKNMAYLIDLFVCIIWGGFTFYITARVFHLDVVDQKIDLAPVLGIYAGVCTQFGIILNFHRGSSQGSVDKQRTIDRMTQ